MEIVFEHLEGHGAHSRILRGELLSLSEMLTVVVEGQKLTFPLSEIGEVIEIANGCVVYTTKGKTNETSRKMKSSGAGSFR